MFSVQPHNNNSPHKSQPQRACHTPISSSYQLRSWGFLTEVKASCKLNSNNRPPKRQEGDIRGFSRKSRRRLMITAAKFNAVNNDVPIFITLTYPKNFPTERLTITSHLHNFLKHFKVSFPSIKYIWKLEFQKRGAPHYHIIIRGLGQIDDNMLRRLQKYVSNSWYFIVGSGDQKHYQSGTRVEIPRSLKRTLSYLFKYMSKADENPDVKYDGRRWGKSYDYVDDPKIDVELDRDIFFRIKRNIRRYLRSQRRTNSNYIRKFAQAGNHSVFVPITVLQRLLIDELSTDFIEELSNSPPEVNSEHV